MVNVTLQSLLDDYLNYVQANQKIAGLPPINANSPNTWWAIQGGAMAAFFLDLYYNLQLIQNSIYTQNSVGDQIDQKLYELGLPQRGALTYGTVEVQLTSTSPQSIYYQQQFTDSVTGNIYQSLQNITIPDNTSQYTLYALNAGSNYIEPIGATLTNGAITFGVHSSTNGQIEESDQSCIDRILQANRSPLSGARSTDYAVYALQSNILFPAPEITDSIIIPSFTMSGAVGLLGVFVLVGTSITEYQLNLGLVGTTVFNQYSRQAGLSTINTTTNYIKSLRLVGLTVTVGTSITQLVTSGISTLPISVSLADGYNALTLISLISQNSNNQPVTIQLTVGQLIQREVRRAICNQPYGATPIGTISNNYITIDSIIYALNLQLSATNGQLAQILTNIDSSASDIQVHFYTYNTSNLYYTYDITAYSDIVITYI